MIDWEQEIKKAREASHKFYGLADSYMCSTGCSKLYHQEKFDRRVFKTILDGIPNFEQVWRVITVLHHGSLVTCPSKFTPFLFSRALELANDTHALRAIIDDENCPPKIKGQAAAKFPELEEKEDEDAVKAYEQEFPASDQDEDDIRYNGVEDDV